MDSHGNTAFEKECGYSQLLTGPKNCLSIFNQTENTTLHYSVNPLMALWSNDYFNLEEKGLPKWHFDTSIHPSIHPLSVTA